MKNTCVGKAMASIVPPWLQEKAVGSWALAQSNSNCSVDVEPGNSLVRQ